MKRILELWAQASRLVFVMVVTYESYLEFPFPVPPKGNTVMQPFTWQYCSAFFTDNNLASGLGYCAHGLIETLRYIK